MRAVRLIAVDDEYSSELGVVIKGVSQCEGMMADRENGTLIAHDLLEHVNGPDKIGLVWDELQALGAIWLVRGRHGDLLNGNNYHTPQVNLAADVSRMFGEIGDLDCEIPDPRTHRHDYDEDFDHILDIARGDIRAEHPDTDPKDVLRYLDRAKAHMRIGFRKAARRYGMGYAGANQFRAVRDAVKLACPEWEGHEFILRYGNGHADIRETIRL